MQVSSVTDIFCTDDNSLQSPSIMTGFSSLLPLVFDGLFMIYGFRCNVLYLTISMFL